MINEQLESRLENKVSSLFNFFETDLLLLMKYKINPGENQIKLFGKQFFENNKDKCEIIYNDELYLLREYFQIEDIKEQNNNSLDIFLFGFQNLFDISYMFDNCTQLEEFYLVINSHNENIKKNNYEENIDNFHYSKIKNLQ